jgi:hypothetical protein
VSSKKYSKQFAWSPELVQSGQRERLWRLYLKRVTGKHVSEAAIERTRLAACEQTAHKEFSIQQIIDNLKEAKTARLENQKRHFSLRENYLERLAEAIVLRKSPKLNDVRHAQVLEAKTKKALKRILHQERMRRMYKNIGACLNPKTDNTGGISRIDIPAPGPGVSENSIDLKTWKGPWMSVTDLYEIGFHTGQIKSAI